MCDFFNNAAASSVTEMSSDMRLHTCAIMLKYGCYLVIEQFNLMALRWQLQFRSILY